MEEHRPKKLLDQVRDAIRLKHYSYRTEGWIKRYICFQNVRHPSAMGAPEVEAYLALSWPKMLIRPRWLSHQLVMCYSHRLQTAA